MPWYGYLALALSAVTLYQALRVIRGQDVTIANLRATVITQLRDEPQE